MLPVNDPGLMRQEIDAAVRRAKEVNAGADARIARYKADMTSRAGTSMAVPVYENHGYELVNNLVPHLIFDNPRVALSSAESSVGAESINADQVGLNQLIRDVGFDDTGTRVAYDVLFGYGVFILGMEVTPGYEQWPEPRPLRPTVTRGSPKRFFQDDRNAENPRFRGHIWVKDLDDLKTAAGADGTPTYDPKMLEQLTPDSGLEEAGFDQAKDKDGPSRQQIVGYEFYVPETGMLYTLAYNGTQSVYLREPRKWIGNHDGPYIVAGLNLVPDEPWPLAPLQATERTQETLNMHCHQMDKDAGVAKTITIVDADQPTLKKAVVNGTNGSVWAIKGVGKDGINKIEVGGVNPANVEYSGLLRERLDRQSGITDTQRGNVSGSTTATAEAIADRAGDVRTKAAQRAFRKAVVKVLKGLLYIMQTYEDVSFGVNVTGVDNGMGEPMTYKGGQQGSNGMAPPSAVGSTTIEIEPYSMEFINAATLQANITEGVSLALEVSNAAIVNPAIKWQAILNDWGQAHNMTNAGTRWIDPNIMQQLQLGHILQGQQPGAEMGEPMPPEQGAPPGGGKGGAKQHGAGRSTPEGPRNIIGEESARMRNAQHPATV